MRIFHAALLLGAAVLLGGCSRKSLSNAWQRTKQASYNAVTDPVTWGPTLAATTLYATGADSRVSQYLVDHPVANEDYDELFRSLNGVVTYTTAVLIHDEHWETKAERVAVEWSAFAVTRVAVQLLNENISKETPTGGKYDSVGSQHAMAPFAGAAMTRRNVAQMDVPSWLGYSIVGTNYLFAASSTLTRVQEGDHTLADQMVSVVLGNFIGLFMHDVFMLETDTRIDVALSADRAAFGISYAF